MLLHDTCCLGIAKPGRIQSSYITATLGVGLGGGGQGGIIKPTLPLWWSPKQGGIKRAGSQSKEETKMAT